MHMRPRVTPEFKKFITDLKERMQLNWFDMLINAAKFSLQEEQDIGNSVLMNCYIHAYQKTNDYKIVSKKRKNSVYRDIFIFYITRANTGRYNVYYKYDLQSEIILYKLKESMIHHTIRDQFSLELDELIPR